MADSTSHPVKRCLGNVAMHVTRFRNRRDKTFSVLRWKIEKFLTVKDSVRHKRQVERLNWMLKLDKKRYSVTVTIESGSKHEVTTGFVCYKSLKFSEPVAFEKVFGGVYKADFGPQIVNHKDNEILKKQGRLELCFLFDVKWKVSTCPHTYYEKRSPNDEMILSREVMESLLWSCRTSVIQLMDFEFLVEKEKFYAHKAILTTRSPFLKTYINFCKDGERGTMKTVCMMPEDMTTVLQYIYKGISKMANDVDLRIGIFKSANFFRIASLKEAYQELLLRDMNGTNVLRIKAAGTATETSSLIDAAETYISEHGS